MASRLTRTVFTDTKENTGHFLEGLVGKMITNPSELAAVYTEARLKEKGYPREAIFNFRSGITNGLVVFHSWDKEGEATWITTPKGHYCLGLFHRAIPDNYFH